MAIPVTDKPLLDEETKAQAAAQVTRVEILEQLKNLNATALDIKALLTKIHDEMFPPVTGITVDPGPPTTR